MRLLLWVRGVFEEKDCLANAVNVRVNNSSLKMGHVTHMTPSLSVFLFN